MIKTKPIWKSKHIKDQVLFLITGRFDGWLYEWRQIR